jgi:hypothetical protein
MDFFLFFRKKFKLNFLTYYIPSAKFFMGNFFANERKHP